MRTKLQAPAGGFAVRGNGAGSVRPGRTVPQPLMTETIASRAARIGARKERRCLQEWRRDAVAVDSCAKQRPVSISAALFGEHDMEIARHFHKAAGAQYIRISDWSQRSRCWAPFALCPKFLYSATLVTSINAMNCPPSAVHAEPNEQGQQLSTFQ